MLEKKSTVPSATTEILGAAGESVGLKAERLNSIHAHKDMLAALYHLPPTFSHESFASAQASILRLANVAGIYDCEHVVKAPIESHLRLYKDEVLESCSNNPTDMLELSMAVKSEWIFMEAATHLLGRNKVQYDAAQPKLNELNIATLLNKKRSQFIEMLQVCEYTLLRLEAPASDRRHQDSYPYVSMGAFRQWICNGLAEGIGSSLGEDYANMYYTIGSGCREAFGTVCGKFAVQGDRDQLVRALQPYLGDILARAQVIIQPLLKEVSRRQFPNAYGYVDLTCMAIGDAELPWVKQ